MSKGMWHLRSIERTNNENRWRRAGIKGATIKRYYELLTLQGGVCGICGDPPQETRKLALDHDHETGEIRGLLCGSCNYKLGVYEKWIKEGLREKADAYLARPSLPPENLGPDVPRPIIAERRIQIVRLVESKAIGTDTPLGDIVAEVADLEGLSTRSIRRYIAELNPDLHLRSYRIKG